MMDHVVRSGEAAAATEVLQPLAAAKSDRIVSLDFIRGIAVMGILAANIVGYGQPWSAYAYPGAFLTEHGPLSDKLWIAQFVLIDGKMRGLFTLLFGAGIYLFLGRAWASGATIWLQVRRLAVLLFFGLLHYYLVWGGDILIYYALLGLVALPFVKLSAEALLKVGLVGYFLGALLEAAMTVPLYLVAETPLGNRPVFTGLRQALTDEKSGALAEDAIDNRYIIDGDYLSWVRHRFEEHGAEPFVNLTMFALEMLPLILLGMAFYRLGLFSERLDRRRQTRWGWAALAAGAFLSFGIALWVESTGFDFYASQIAHSGLSAIPRLLMIVGLAALLAVWGAGANGWLGQRVSAAGRTAFSNYLGTSLVMLLVFHGWAAGLYGKLVRPELYLVALATCMLMLLWSKPWLARFQYGPLEWVWRCLTYGRWISLAR